MIPLFQDIISQQSEEVLSAYWQRIFFKSQYHNLKDTDLLLNQIVSSNKSLVKISLCRFLSRQDSILSTNLIILLMKDENRIVADHAIRAFDKNEYNDKFRLLTKSLLNLRGPSLNFAIDQLTSQSTAESVDPLLSLLESGTLQIKKRILSGFRNTPDRRIIQDITPYTSSENEILRFESLMCFCSLYEDGYNKARPLLIKHLNDPTPIIRQGIIWTLRRRTHFGNQKIFKSIALNDSDPQVRQEAIFGLAACNTISATSFLIDIYHNEKNRVVLLKTEAAILSLPEKLLLPTLKYLIYWKRKYHNSRRILNLFAHYANGSESYLKFLLKKLKFSSSQQNKIQYIEAIGHLGNTKGLTYLEPYLKESTLISYTTTSAIVNIWGKAQDISYEKYIDLCKNNKQNLQIILKHLLKTMHNKSLNKGIGEFLIENLSDPNINIRYLSSQILVKANYHGIIKPFIGALANESDPTTRHLLQSTISNFIQHRLPSFLNILRDIPKDSNEFNIALEIFSTCSLSASQLILIAEDLVDRRLNLLNHSFKDLLIPRYANALALKGFTLHQLEIAFRSKALFIKFLSALVPALDEIDQTLEINLKSFIGFIETNIDFVPANILNLFTHDSTGTVTEFLCRTALHPTNIDMAKTSKKLLALRINNEVTL